MFAARQLNSASPLQCLLAALAATGLPAAAFAGVTGSFGVGWLTFLVAMGHATALGLPLYALLRWRRAANVLTATATGLAVGALPVAALLFPGGGRYKGASHWSGGVAHMIDGVPTQAGWNDYYALVGQFGGFGAMSGLVFALTLAWWRRSEA